MKKISYPFDLHGHISIQFKKNITPVFLETCGECCTDLSINDFVVKSFSYDAESRLLQVSLQKAINATDVTESDTVMTGEELENNVIKLDLIYCLYNAAIISSHISYPLDDKSFIKSIAVSKPLTLSLK
ncbi:hypothetical protein [Photobacterium damselae]|uniref:hypothetical protein n=1 Tax=Photobacterium damselae TaxID=38293 RepID=UPI003C6E67EC|nr:hypothetical protein [Photobacterium damselae]